jgi:nucleotide-binding universal stress UspA family protein
MSRIKSVLVAVDFSAGSMAAVDCATGLARRFGARLLALHVTRPYSTYDPLPAFPPPAPLDPDRLRTIREDLRRLVASTGPEHPPGEVFVREGDPADEILAQAAEEGVDLVVLGTHGQRGFERWILGSVTERVARKASCSVLGVPPAVRISRFERVLCGLDLSDSSATTLELAAGVAQTLVASLTVLYVADGSHWYEPGPVSGVDTAGVRQAVAAFARDRLGELIARHVPKGIPVDVQVAFGRAPREIERVATEGADLVVLGASSSRGVDRFFFGSTAQHVLRAGVGAVLLVRPTKVTAEPTGATKEPVALRAGSSGQ